MGVLTERALAAGAAGGGLVSLDTGLSAALARVSAFRSTFLTGFLRGGMVK